MTSYSSHKKKIRALAEREGITYAEARTRLAKSMNDFLDLAEQMFDAQKTAETERSPFGGKYRFDPAEVTCTDRTLGIPRPSGTLRLYSVQQATDVDFKQPLPYFISEHGLVFNQQIWNGELLMLHGFAATGAEEDLRAEKEGRPSGRLVLTRQQFFDNPRQALGLAPVFRDRDAKFVYFESPVVDIQVDWGMPVTSASEGVVTLATSDDVAHAVLPIGQLLPLLPRDVLGKILTAAEKNPGRALVLYGDPVGWDGKLSAVDIILDVLRIGARFDALAGLPPIRFVALTRFDKHLDKLSEEADYLDAEDIWDKMRTFATSDTRAVVEPLVAEGTDPLVFVLDSLRDDTTIDIYERKRIDAVLAEQGLVWPTITFDAEALEGVRRAASGHIGVHRLDFGSGTVKAAVDAAARVDS